MKVKTSYLFLVIIILLNLRLVVNAQSLQVYINKKNGPSPTSSPVVFTVVFSSAINVASFTPASIVLSGTAQNQVISSIIQMPPKDGTTFEITVTASNNGTVIATIPAAATFYTPTVMGTTGNSPHGILIDASGNVYTANAESNNVSKITAAGVSSIFATTGRYPYAITKDAAGNLYTANAYNGTISRISTTGVSSIFATTGTHPYAITIDGSGKLYAANSYASTVSEITTGGVSQLFATTESFPGSIITDGSGNVYTANYGDNSITKITPSGATTLRFANTGSGPFDITLDASGNLYTTNWYDNTISKITPAGVTSLFSTTGGSPQAITIDGSGNLYTANGDGTVSKITMDGTSKIIGNTGKNPVDIIIDVSGNIYTADNTSNTVTKLTPSGIALLGSDLPTNEASTSTDNTYVLPVSLLYFTANTKNCIVTLNWQTTGEINSTYYGIETSTDGRLYLETEKVAGKNNNAGAAYTYTFKSIEGGSTYYRLKMVDKDGNYNYSKTVEIIGNGNCIASAQPIISPNPAKDFITVEGIIKGNHLTLINAAGILLSTMEAKGSTQRIDISTYARGVYMLRIEAEGGSVHIVKVVKQ